MVLTGACQLLDLLACRLVGLLESWEVGGTDRGAGYAGGGRASGRTERQGRGSHTKRAGARAGHQKKRGWAHPPLSFPRERGEEERRVHPPIVTEQGTEKSEE